MIRIVQQLIVSIVIVALVQLVGCAKSSVSDARETEWSPGSPPRIIWVRDFAWEDSPANSTRQQQSQSRRLLGVLTDAVADNLNRADLNARRLPPGDADPTEGWLVTGELTSANTPQGASGVMRFGGVDADLFVAVTALGDLGHFRFMDFGLNRSRDRDLRFLPQTGANDQDMRRAGKIVADEIARVARQPRQPVPETPVNVR